jgi:DNA polymerase-4
MPIAEAVRLCPQGIFLRGNMKRYREKSEEIMAVFGDFSPQVQQLSIDEAFLDITGTQGIFGPPARLAQTLKERIRRETGLTVSTGLGSNKYIAKIASGISKPDGLFVIDQGGEEAFMLSLPVGKIWGAGPKTQELFKAHGFKTCRDLHRLSMENIVSIFGNSLGLFLYRAVRGEAASAFDEERGSHSMSAERTFEFDLYDAFAMETALFDICQTLMWRLLDQRWQSRTVSIKIRYGDFSTESGRETFQNPVRTFTELHDHIMVLFHKKYQTGRGVRLLGAGLMNLEPQRAWAYQAELFDAPPGKGASGGEKERRLEETILEINKKFPQGSLKRGRSWLAGD